MTDTANPVEAVALRHPPAAIVAVGGDPDFQILYSNAEFADALTLRESPAGRRLADVIPSLGDETQRQLQHVLRSGRPCQLHTTESTVSSKSTAGTILKNAEYAPVMTATGALHSIIISWPLPAPPAAPYAGRDAPAPIDEHEAKLRKGLGIAPVTVLHRDLELRVVWFYNPLLHRSVRRLLGLTPEDIYQPDSAAALRAFYQPILQRGERAHTLIRLTSAWTGVSRLFDLFAEPLVDEQGVVCGISCAAYDVTRMAAAQQALAARKEQLRLALDAAHMAEWEYDLRRGKVIHSDSLARLLGLPELRSPSEPETLINCLLENDRDMVKKSFTDAIAAQRSNVTQQFRIVRPDGSQRWIAARGSIQYDEGQPVRIVGINMDITEEKEALLLLERANSELEQFAYTASHDLKEPMRTISNFATLLERHLQANLDQRTRGYLESIRRGTRRMEHFINSLLEYARTSYMTDEWTAVDLDAVLTEVLEQLGSALAESSCEVSHDRLPVVRGHKERLGNVLQNLLSNAMKFRREELPVHIHLSAERHGDYWQIKVADNGLGIEPETAARLFEPFHRLARDQNRPGTGIGLALCKKVVESHGGRIWVEQNPGGGSVFLLTVPAIGPAPETAA